MATIKHPLHYFHDIEFIPIHSKPIFLQVTCKDVNTSKISEIGPAIRLGDAVTKGNRDSF